MNKPSSPRVELASMSEVQRMLPWRSRTTIYERLRNDPSFPRPRRTGPHSIAWVRSEVEQWIESLPVVELDGLGAIDRRRGGRQS